jgi:hypothetical protein
VAEKTDQAIEAAADESAARAQATAASGESVARPEAAGGAAATHEADAPATGVVGAADEDEPEPADEADDEAVDEEPDDDVDGDESDDYREERVVVVRRGIFYAVAGVAILAIAVLAGLNAYQLTKSNDPAVAVVNGTKIPRSQYDKIVANTSSATGQPQGEAVVDQLVNNALLEQDAAKQHVTASPDEIDAALKTERTNAGLTNDSDYKNALQQAHLTETQLRAQLKDQVLLQKLVLNKVAVSEDEITQEYNQNKDTTYQGKQLSDVHDQIKATLLQQKQQTAEQTYFDNLQAKAKISRHVPGES